MIGQPVVRKRGHRRLSRQLAAVLNSSEADQVIAAALAVLAERARFTSGLMSPGAVRDYLRLTLGRMEREEFWGAFLDAQHRVIAFERLFIGTLTQCAVHPREIVRAALAHNAAAVIFAHPHPSGVAQPSHADELLTRTLKEALALVDVKVLDHFVIAGAAAVSFAERGLL
jgi:DNA repair protein RadC